MTDQPNLDLPATAPVLENRHSSDMYPAALYTLVDTPEYELNELQRACESETGVDNGQAVKLPPRARFFGDPLRAVYGYHLELCGREKFDQIMFIVAIDRNWKENGVLLVSLDADPDDEQCRTDMFRIRAEMSGGTVVGIQLGNTDWEESKETDLLVIEENGGNDDDDGDDAKSGPQPSAADDEGDPESGPIPPRKPTPLGYFIGVYGIDGVDRTSLIRNLQPGYEHGSSEHWALRLQGILPATLGPAGVVSAAMDLHPRRCERNPWLHKFLFFVADTPSPKEDGIVLVSLGGKSEARGKIFPARSWQRLPFTAIDATQNAVCMMNMGYRSWLPPDSPAMAVFMCGAAEQRYEMVSMLDPKASKRVAGEEVVVLIRPGMEWSEAGGKWVEYSLAESVRRWPKICFDERFRGTMTRSYFVCVDRTEGDDVLLVKVDWDGDVNAKNVDLSDRFEVQRVEARKVHQLVKDLLSGTAAWEGAKLP